MTEPRDPGDLDRSQAIIDRVLAEQEATETRAHEALHLFRCNLPNADAARVVWNLLSADEQWAVFCSALEVLRTDDATQPGAA